MDVFTNFTEKNQNFLDLQKCLKNEIQENYPFVLMFEIRAGHRLSDFFIILI